LRLRFDGGQLKNLGFVINGINAKKKRLWLQLWFTYTTMAMITEWRELKKGIK
jgi:hypothetical protein